MPASGLLAVVSSALRPGGPKARNSGQDAGPGSQRDEEPGKGDVGVVDESSGLLGISSRRSASTGAPLDPAYGTLPIYTGSSAGIYPASTAHEREPGHEDHDDALDGNDAAVWRDVQTGGLDGRGSIVETDEDEDGEREQRGNKWDDEQAMLQDVTYRRTVIKYLSVPLVTLLALACLALLARYAWPPTPPQRRAGAPYPHPFLAQPFLVGIFSSLSVQALRAPVFDILQSTVLALASRDSLGAAGSVVLVIASIGAHTTLHELTRLLSLLLVCSEGSAWPSATPIPPHGVQSGLGLGPETPTAALPATSLLQIVFHLALGWGAAEASWGIASAWARGLRLYCDVMRRPTPRVVIEGMGARGGPAQGGKTRGRWWRLAGGARRARPSGDIDADAEQGALTPPRQVEADGRHVVVAEDFADTAVAPDSDEGSSAGNDEDEDADEEREEEDLERKIEMLERIKGRRDLEAVLGRPFPNIPLVLHLLWRIDTLLLNLGLTLLVSAYYFNAEPIYPPSHAHQARPRGDGSAGDEADAAGPRATHKLLPLVVVAAVVVHSVITIAWNLGVRKLGVGAVSWSSLILSLASLFAGIGAWGGLV